MQNNIILIITLFSLSKLLYAEQLITWETLPFNKKNLKILEKGEIIADSVSTTFTKKGKKRQDLDFKLAGLHERECRIALSKISRYEKYSKWVGPIKKSSYNDKNQELKALISHTFLPRNLSLKFKIPRMRRPGRYPFEFKSGFLPGLKGVFHISERKKRCLFFLKVDWEGNYSKIPSFTLQFFSKALAVLGVERMFKISRTY